MTELPPDDGYVTAPYPGGAGPQDSAPRFLARLAAAVLPIRTGAAAVKWAATHEGPGWFDQCLRFVRSSFNVAGGYATARASWLSTTHRHAFVLDPPVGVPIWWSDAGAWHVALSAGGGWCYSTDILRHGYVDRVPVSLIQKAWGLTPVGWAEEINATRVYVAPPAPKPPPPKPPPVPPVPAPVGRSIMPPFMYLATAASGPAANGRVVCVGLSPTPRILPAAVANRFSLTPGRIYYHGSTGPTRAFSPQEEAEIVTAFGVPTTTP